MAELSNELAQAPDTEELERSFPFNGAMILDDDPINIGAANYADVQNLRYTNSSLEGVQGYTQINTTAIVTDTALRSGIQFVKSINGTPQSHALVQSFNAGLTASKVYLNKTAIPSQGDFEAATLHTDSASAGLGRFALGPDGSVIYCNGDETYIWGSDEHRIAAVTNFDDAGGTTFSYDFTNRLNNTHTDTANKATLVRRDGTNDIYLYIGSTRPLKGIKFYVDVANAGTSTSTVEYWAVGGWTAVAGFSDGTLSAGVTLAQTGTMSFTSTVSVAQTRILDDRFLYFYRVIVGATGTPDATIELSQVTFDAPFQSMVDIWDGVERNPVQFQLDCQSVSEFLDFTLDVQAPSFSAAPVAADLSTVDLGDFWLVAFEERMTAVRYRMASNFVNNNTNVLVASYWNGTAWVAVSNLVDGTSVGGVVMAKSGLVTWTPPAVTAEFEVELFGLRAFYYRFHVINMEMENTPGTKVDVVTGIPAQRFDKDRPIQGYKFPLAYRGRLLLCGQPLSNDGNRIDYSSIGAPDVHNGADSSDLGKAIFVGDHEDLTAGAELFNRFGDVITMQAVLTKARETWLLVGSAPENFQVFPVSETVGCPCPLTMDRADVSFSVDSSAVRNIAIWVSFKGPMMFDGGILSPMRFSQADGTVSSIDPYFDPNDSRYITVSALENARGWFDPQFSEYNLLLPTAASTTNNVWLVCDMRRRKWFRKVPTTYPQMGFRVVDVNGGQYVYGGVDSGRMIRLEDGQTWDGGALSHSLRTADMLLSTNVWDEIRLRFIRLTVLAETGVAGSVSMTHSPNGLETFSAIASLTLLSSGTDRYRRVTDFLNLLGWSHQFEITFTAQSDKVRAPRLTNWGIKYNIERDSGFDSIDNTVGQGLTGPSATP